MYPSIASRSERNRTGGFSGGTRRNSTDTPSQPRSSAKKAAREETVVNRSETDDDGLRERVIRNAKMLGVVWGRSCGHQPNDLTRVVLGAMARIGNAGRARTSGGNRFSKARCLGRNYARLAVIVAAVVVVNILTWSGTAWAIWAGGFFVFCRGHSAYPHGHLIGQRVDTHFRHTLSGLFIEFIVRQGIDGGSVARACCGKTLIGRCSRRNWCRTLFSRQVAPHREPLLRSRHG